MPTASNNGAVCHTCAFAECGLTLGLKRKIKDKKPRRLTSTGGASGITTPSSHQANCHYCLSATSDGLLPSIAHTPYVPPHPARRTPYHLCTLLLLPHVDPTAKLSLSHGSIERDASDVRKFCARTCSGGGVCGVKAIRVVVAVLHAWLAYVLGSFNLLAVGISLLSRHGLPRVRGSYQRL